MLAVTGSVMCSCVSWALPERCVDMCGEQEVSVCSLCTLHDYEGCLLQAVENDGFTILVLRKIHPVNW